MKYVHPFPARMAPEIALEHVQLHDSSKTILDPMCGSGMVLNQCAVHGVNSIGCDLDPLARLISKVGSTRVRESSVWKHYDHFIDYYEKNKNAVIRLPWIDECKETQDFINYWYGPKQIKQLRVMSSYFSTYNPKFLVSGINVLCVALSRLIVTKEPKASLARDTAHSRPHRTIDENDFDIVGNLQKSIAHVLSALNSSDIIINTRTYLLDARRMSRLDNNSVDAIITSPPYLNAIDYMRGHKFSLVWFGYPLSSLRAIRKAAIGSEAGLTEKGLSDFEYLLSSIELRQIKPKLKRLLDRYYLDLTRQLKECKRVLKPGGTATMVIGNSSVFGEYVRNSEILKYAAKHSNLELLDERERTIPNYKRYLPPPRDGANALSSRMRAEHVIQFSG